MVTGALAEAHAELMSLCELRAPEHGRPDKSVVRNQLRYMVGHKLENGLKGGELVVYQGKSYWVTAGSGSKADLVSTDWTHQLSGVLVSQVESKRILWPKKLGSVGMGESLRDAPV